MPLDLAKRRVILAGLFSAKLEAPATELDALEERVRAHGGIVVGRVQQRRGVSRSRDPGGAKRLEHALSPRTLLGSGKALELAELCRATRADLVLFWNPLTPHQRDALAALTGTDVEDATSLATMVISFGRAGLVVARADSEHMSQSKGPHDGNDRHRVPPFAGRSVRAPIGERA